MAVKDIDAKTLAYIKQKILEVINIDEIVQKAAEAAKEAVEGIVEEAVEEEVQDKKILFLDDEGQIIGNTGPINIKPTLEHSDIRPIQIGPSGIIIGYDGNPIKKDNISGLVTELDGKVGASGFLDDSGKVKFEKVADLGNFAKKDTLIFTDVTGAIGSTGASAFRTSIGAKDIEWTPSQQDLINKGAFIGDVSTNSDGEVIVQRGATGFSFAKPSINSGKLVVGNSIVSAGAVGAVGASGFLDASGKVIFEKINHQDVSKFATTEALNTGLAGKVGASGFLDENGKVLFTKVANLGNFAKKDNLVFADVTGAIGSTGAATFRSIIGAGTSNITETDVNNVAQGKIDALPAWSKKDKFETAFSEAVVGATGAAAFRSIIGAGTSNITETDVGNKITTVVPSWARDTNLKMSTITSAIGSTGASAFRNSIGLGSLATKSTLQPTDIPEISSTKISNFATSAQTAARQAGFAQVKSDNSSVNQVSYSWDSTNRILTITLSNINE